MPPVDFNLKAAHADPAAWIKPAGKPLTFQTTGQAKDVTLVVAEANDEISVAGHSLQFNIFEPLTLNRPKRADFLAQCHDTNHQCGGLRMSTDPSQGVTDRNLKVHGCDNLYVAGAAVFPSSSFANPTYTAMALGLRLADHLSSRGEG